MPMNPGPQQTETWPSVWSDLDPNNLPGWVVWQRTCQFKGSDGEPCPRRVQGAHFNVRYCDHHCPEGISHAHSNMIG
jgi:hypothetical protein